MRERAEAGAPSGPRQEDGPHFAFQGHTFLIVTAGEPSERHEGATATGFLQVDGRDFVILMVEDASRPRQDGLSGVLTRRELEIVYLIAEGCCDKEIARRLGISNYTVREHIRRTCAKLGVTRRAAIVSEVLSSVNGNRRSDCAGPAARHDRLLPVDRTKRIEA
jgi:DNA-binding CsgD family transcriptional regulator